ncbi:Ig-like domain-containing protein [Methanosarcina hadiensis]|uniref:Ig-like domain-containing protein n=1 Tax=Methanosarcina hadiensis TaxID=3078083 RepID=UPI0039778B02
MYRTRNWPKILLGAFAGIAFFYIVKRYRRDRHLPAALKSIPVPFKHRPAPPTIKAIYPDRQTFAYRHDSPIWIEFDMPMNSTTITKDTVIVKSSASTKPVDGILDAGSKMLMFRPCNEYPMDEHGAEITIYLLGNETGSGFIMDERGIALDGDKDGKAGGDFVYTYRIVR